MWAERLVQTRLGMEPLSQARALKGSYRPDGKISTDYLVSVKSAERTALRISLDEWLLHHAAALHEGRRPLLVLVGRKLAPIILVAMPEQEFLDLRARAAVAKIVHRSDRGVEFRIRGASFSISPKSDSSAS